MLEPPPGIDAPPPFGGDERIAESLWARAEQLLLAAVKLDDTDDGGSHDDLVLIWSMIWLRAAEFELRNSDRVARQPVQDFDASRARCGGS